MIPISSTQVKKVKDPDPDSTAVLHLRYLTGEYLDRFMALQNGDSQVLAKYRSAAEKTVKAANHGKSRRELMPLIVKEMTRLAHESGDIEGQSSGFKDTREMIDIFLCGWEGGTGWPAFPSDGKPSRMFMLGDLMKIAELITDNTEDLTKISLDDAKN
jgi:hypothetical protein